LPDPSPADLERAYRELQPPPPHRELREEDAATRASVAWLAQAWSALEAPAGSTIRRAPAARSAGSAGRRAIRLRQLVLLGAAAAILALAFAPLFREASDPRHEPASARLAAAASSPAAAPIAHAAPAIEVLHAGRDRVELRSGAVRLTLLPARASGRAATPATASPDTSSTPP
jgi:hypothetical protein